MRCGSWRAVVAEATLARSPASSCTRDAHSGSQASTLRAARAGAANPRHAAKRTINLFIGRLRSETMRAVSAEAVDVLQDDLIVLDAQHGAILRKLEAKPGKLARRIIEHDRMPIGPVLLGCDRRRAEVDGAGVKPVVPVARPPSRHELENPLGVPAGLLGAIRLR